MERDIGHRCASKFGNLSTLATLEPTASFKNPYTENNLQSIRTVIAMAYVVVFCTGITGNGIVIYTFLRMVSKLRKLSVTDLYVLSLAAIDFLFVLNSPFAAIDMAMGGSWIFGGVVCKVFVSVGYFSLCAGVLIVMAMSIDRFQSVVFAVKTRKIRTSRRAKRIICAIWFFAFVYMAPAAVFAGAWKNPSIKADNTTKCLMKFENIFTLNVRQVVVIHTIFRFLVAFLIPFVVLVLCNLTIVHFLRKRREKKLSARANNAETRKRANEQMRGEKRVTRLILLVTTVFLVCFFPNLVLNALWVMGDAFELFDIHRGDTYRVALWSSVFLLHLNSALNPFLYAFSGTGYRKRIKEAITCSSRRRSVKGSHRSVHGMTKSPHSAEVRVIQRDNFETELVKGQITCESKCSSPRRSRIEESTTE